jgi:hypothetical protein
MRGKIRDSVRPALEQWDPRSIDGLFKLSEITRKLYDMIDLNIANIFNRIRKTKFNEYPLFADSKTTYNSVKTYIKFKSKNGEEKMYIYICDIKVRDVTIYEESIIKGIIDEDLLKELREIMEIDESRVFFQYEKSLYKKRVRISNSLYNFYL